MLHLSRLEARETNPAATGRRMVAAQPLANKTKRQPLPVVFDDWR